MGLYGQPFLGVHRAFVIGRHILLTGHDFIFSAFVVSEFAEDFNRSCFRICA